MTDTDLRARVAEARRDEATATARAEALEARLAAMTRHDLREPDSGRYRARSEAESHAQTVVGLLAQKRARNTARVFGSSDPLNGLTPTTGPTETPFAGTAGANPYTFRSGAQEDAREAFLDGLFPNRGAGRRFHPYSLTGLSLS